MTLEIPSIASETTTIANEIAASTGDPVPAASVLHTLAAALAGTAVSVYRYAARRWLDQFVRHASTEETSVLGRTVIPLVELGHMEGVGDPEPAFRAILSVQVTVLTQGGTLAIGSQLRSASNGVTYTTRAEVPLNAAAVTASVTATSDPNDGGGYGAVGNLDPGAVLSFSSPVRDVARDAVVLSRTQSGLDAESWDAYRTRVLDRRRLPPQGGAYTDYRTWARAIAGVETAFPYTDSPGVVQLYVRATPESSGSEDGVPTIGQLAAVENYIRATTDGLVSRLPINHGLEVKPIARRAFDIVIHGLTVTDPIAADGAFNEGCDEFLRTREPFIVGLSALPRLDRITVAEVAGVVSQIAASFGGTITRVTLYADEEDLLAYTLTLGEHAKLGAITYSET